MLLCMETTSPVKLIHIIKLYYNAVTRGSEDNMFLYLCIKHLAVKIKSFYAMWIFLVSVRKCVHTS